MPAIHTQTSSASSNVIRFALESCNTTSTAFRDWISRIPLNEPDPIPESELWKPKPKVSNIKTFYHNHRYFKFFTGHRFPVGGCKK